MQQIIAIGGGEFAGQPEDIELEKYILAQTNTARPEARGFRLVQHDHEVVETELAVTYLGPVA